MSADIELDAAMDMDIEQPLQATAGLANAAGESLPWVEKYRPVELSDLVSQKAIIDTIVRFVDKKSMPHMLFYGPPGTGKTSTILACARKLYGTSYRNMILELNASDDRGIDVVRDEIKAYASTKTIFNKGFKLIILDEADSMTSAAQAALRRIIEKYSQNVRFCIICNYVSKILPAIQSRCTRFRFNLLDETSIRKRLDHIATSEGVEVTNEGYDALIQLSGGDMRRAVNVLQATHAAFKKVDFDNVYMTTASPMPSDIERIFTWLLNDDFATALSQTSALCVEKGYALADLLSLILDRVSKLEMPNQSKVLLYETMADIEHRISQGCTDILQLGSLVAAFRLSIELAASSEKQ